ncbi:carbohydrate ABC transporter permease [Microaerobacter geothermalis]|uniref:carbohydrate ABC transporter permease n=1 Tax=Microaerobacter geothermalis TaxID=674972 RepID=UPI001F250630|nr:carbohydrate ABC transporter permease [Microaerobacter geothermalis]MCF6093614.1 carbohydrate ABC transporter permease [Microaerobacter geothermalis]
MEQRYTKRVLILEIVTILLGLIFLIPFYFIIINSLKSFSEILLNTAAWPKEFQWNNYVEAWRRLQYPKVFLNSLLITVFSNLAIVVFCSMAAYRLVRSPNKISKIIFILFISAMVIPFQSIMIPLVRVTSQLGLLNSIPGIVIMYLGFGAGFSIFLYHGFIKSVPREIEEAAIVDGCSSFGVFWRIVFPLLKPITVTIIILNSLWIWNDFLLPLLVLQDQNLRTIPLATFFFFGQYTKQWDLALAALILGIIPLLIFFFFLQRHIIKGIIEGSIK